jgi:two-component system cell cycle sensor histidine kinase/response regulator CckA
MTRLLVVEDSPTQAEELKLVLRSEGFEVEAASDGASALRRLRAKQFDLVLSDILMPRMSGYELCRAVKSDEARKDLPVILLTTLRDPMDIVEGLESGADNFITKPYEPRYLVRRVQGILENRRMRAEGKLKVGVEIFFLGRKFTITADKQQILDLLISTVEDIVRTNGDLLRSQSELAAAKAKIEEYAQKLEGEVRISTEKYRTLMKHASDAILITEPTGEIIEVNRQAEELLARSASEIVGRRFQEFVGLAERDYAAVQFQKMLAEGSARVTDIHLVRPGAATVCADVSMSLVRTDGQGVVLAIARDVTERNRLQQQVLHNERLATVGTLSAGIAHEINNPTAVILANLDTLSGYVDQVRKALAGLDAIAAEAQGPLKEKLERLRDDSGLDRATAELDEVVRDYVHAGGRIRDIVRDLKSFSHIDDSDVAQVSVNERLDTTLRMALNEVRHRARIEKKYARDLPEIVASPGKLNQLFLNLIVNAAQAIDEGKADRNLITVSTRLDGDRIRVDVTDTGCGIRKEILPRIFDPFFTTKPIGIGTGLGLSICHDIVKKHGGEIQVESEIGRGTTFSVFLPRATGLEMPRRAAAGEIPKVRQANLLVVDDEAFLLRAYQRVLGKHHLVTTALGGRAAAELLGTSEASFDVIFCDVMMPDVDGVDLHRFVAEKCPGLENRMVFITGGAFTERTKEFLERIPNLRLQKPFVAEDLQHAIAALVSNA